MSERRQYHYDRGDRALMDRLRDDAGDWRQKQRMADAAKKRRDTLIAKCVRAGIPSRVVAELAGASSPGVGMIARRIEAELAAGVTGEDGSK